MKGSRLLELDSLRGIAALLVLLSHYTWAYDYHFNLLDEHSFHFKVGGDAGVLLFFMISGYVIFMTLERVKSPAEFIVARFSRLFPTFWFCLFLTLLVVTIFPVPTIGDYSFKEVLANITMVPNLLKSRFVDQVYWSLEVELFFYLIAGIIYFNNFFKQKLLLVLFMWLIFSCISYLFDFPLEKYFSKLFILKQAPLFIAGILFYKLKTGNGNLMIKLLALLSFIVFCIGHFKEIEVVFSGVLIYLVFTKFIFGPIPWLRGRWQVFLGTISYPLYLLHNVIGYSIFWRLRPYIDNQLLYCSITAAIVLVASWLTTYYVEKPLIPLARIKLQEIFNKMGDWGVRLKMLS